MPSPPSAWSPSARNHESPPEDLAPQWFPRTRMVPITSFLRMSPPSPAPEFCEPRSGLGQYFRRLTPSVSPLMLDTSAYETNSTPPKSRKSRGGSNPSSSGSTSNKSIRHSRTMDGNYSGAFDLEDDAMKGYSPPKRNQDQEIEKEAKLLGTQLKGPTHSLKRTATILHSEIYKKASWELKKVARSPITVARSWVGKCPRLKELKSTTSHDESDDTFSHRSRQESNPSTASHAFGSHGRGHSFKKRLFKSRQRSGANDVDGISSSGSRKSSHTKRSDILKFSGSSRKSSKSVAAEATGRGSDLPGKGRPDSSYAAGEASRIITPQLSPKLKSKTTGSLTPEPKMDETSWMRVSTMPPRVDSSYAAGEAARVATPMEDALSPKSSPSQIRAVSYFQMHGQSINEVSCYASGEAVRVPTPQSPSPYPPDYVPDKAPALRRHTTVPEALPSYFDFESERPPLRRASSASQSASWKSEDFAIIPLEAYHDSDSNSNGAEEKGFSRARTHPLPHFIAAPKISRVAPFAAKKDYFTTFHRYNSQAPTPEEAPLSIPAARGLAPGIKFLTKPHGYSTPATSSSSSATGSSFLAELKSPPRRRSSTRSYRRRSSIKDEFLEYNRATFLDSVDEHWPTLTRQETASTRRSSFPKSESNTSEGRVVSWRGVLVTEAESRLLDLFVGVKRRQSHRLSDDPGIRLAPSPEKSPVRAQRGEENFRRYSDDMRYVPSYRESMILATVLPGRGQRLGSNATASSGGSDGIDSVDEKDSRALYAEATWETFRMRPSPGQRRKSYNQDQQSLQSASGTHGTSGLHRSAAIKILERNFNWHEDYQIGEDFAINTNSQSNIRPEWMSASMLYGNMLKEMPSVTEETTDKKRQYLHEKKFRGDRAPSLPLTHRSTGLSFLTSVLDSDNNPDPRAEASGGAETDEKKQVNRIRRLSSAAERRRASIYIWIEKTLKETRERTWTNTSNFTGRLSIASRKSVSRARQGSPSSFAYDGGVSEPNSFELKEGILTDKTAAPESQNLHVRWADSIESRPRGIVYRGIGSTFPDSMNQLQESINHQQACEPILGFHELFLDDAEEPDGDVSPLGHPNPAPPAPQSTTVDITMPPKGTSCAPARTSRTSQRKAFSILGIDSASLAQKAETLRLQQSLNRQNENQSRIEKVQTV